MVVVKIPGQNLEPHDHVLLWIEVKNPGFRQQTER